MLTFWLPWAVWRLTVKSPAIPERAIFLKTAQFDPNEQVIISGLVVEPGYAIAFSILKLAQAHQEVATAIETLAAALSDLAESK